MAKLQSLRRKAINFYLDLALMLTMVLLQEALISGFRLGPARVDLVFILVFFWSITRGGNAGLAWAFGTGLLLDLISGGPVGPFTISLPVIAFMVALISEHVSYANPFSSFAVAALLFIFYDLFQLAVLRFLGINLLRIENFSLITLPSALLNAFVAVPMCLILARIYQGGKK
ncbi:MAG: rod shape-determining protein MreD [Anaerolineae bacterium]|nr:rod shape-determining protein MreD [Anaerolineae bacterium]MDW8102075.1 rod shape-determining protein MreD [Anaerolineae bacterium]